MIHLLKIAWLNNIFFLTGVISSPFIFTYAVSYRKISWIEEITDGLLTVITPSIWLSIQFESMELQLSILSYMLPILCLFLSFRFVFSMIMVEEDVPFSPVFLSLHIHKNSLRIHHFFLFARIWHYHFNQSHGSPLADSMASIIDNPNGGCANGID
jgi:hypothetical protein